MPNDNELCWICGKRYDMHGADNECPNKYPDRQPFWRDTKFQATVSVPASFLDKVRALIDDFDNPDDMAPGTGRYYVDAVREALAEIEKGVVG